MILDPLAIKTFLFDTARLPVYGRRVTPPFFGQQFQASSLQLSEEDVRHRNGALGIFLLAGSWKDREL